MVCSLLPTQPSGRTYEPKPDRVSLILPTTLKGFSSHQQSGSPGLTTLLCLHRLGSPTLLFPSKLPTCPAQLSALCFNAPSVSPGLASSTPCHPGSNVTHAVGPSELPYVQKLKHPTLPCFKGLHCNNHLPTWYML